MLETADYRDALEWIDPAPLDYDSWLGIVFSAKAAGLEQADVLAWSQRSPKHNALYTATRWEIANADGGITAGTIIGLAKQAGWTPLGKAGKRQQRPVSRPVANQAAPGPAKPLPPLYAQPLDGPVTLGDLADMPRWAPTVEKKLHYRWRHSRREGVALARYGGVEVEDDFGKGKVKTLLLPWSTREGVARYGYPTYVMSGDENCPSNDVLVLDCDYKPAADPEGIGREWRDGLRERCADAGMAVIASGSGNGFHAIGRLAPEYFDRGLPSTIGGWKPYLADDGKSAAHGIAVDVFLPGAKRQVLFRWEKATDLNHILPVITGEEVNELLVPPPPATVCATTGADIGVNGLCPGCIESGYDDPCIEEE